MSFFKKDKSKKFSDSPVDPDSLNSASVIQNTTEKTENMENVKAEKPPMSKAPTIDQLKTIEQINNTPPPRMKTFDILVIDEDIDDSGRVIPSEHPENGVKASSARELVSLFAQCGQKIKIIREYDDRPMPPPQPMIPPERVNANIDKILLTGQSVPQHVPMAQPRAPEPPKFFEIGGVKCKLENGKMFQEQWVRVDSTKYRLIADSTNKLVSMNGKHLETLKWVQIEGNDGGSENA